MTDPLYINVYESALYFIVMLFLPLLVLNILNVKLVRALKELNRKRVDMVQNARQKNDNNVTLVLIIVVVVFVICQVPALANRLLYGFLPASSRLCKGLHFFVSIHSNIFAVTNSSINFVIYMAFNPRFRQTILDSPCCLFLSPYCKTNSQQARRGRLHEETTSCKEVKHRSINCCNKFLSQPNKETRTKTTIVTPCQRNSKDVNLGLIKTDNRPNVQKKHVFCEKEKFLSEAAPKILNGEEDADKVSTTKIIVGEGLEKNEEKI